MSWSRPRGPTSEHLFPCLPPPPACVTQPSPIRVNPDNPSAQASIQGVHSDSSLCPTASIQLVANPVSSSLKVYPERAPSSSPVLTLLDYYHGPLYPTSLPWMQQQQTQLR